MCASNSHNIRRFRSSPFAHPVVHLPCIVQLCGQCDGSVHGSEGRRTGGLQIPIPIMRGINEEHVDVE